MLKSVLTKLIECVDTHNRYVLQGPPTVANHYVSKCELLIECLEDAGYKVKFDTEHFEITEGVYRGCQGNLYTTIHVELPFYCEASETDAFEETGFEWFVEDGVAIAIYKFEKNRKEKETA